METGVRVEGELRRGDRFEQVLQRYAGRAFPPQPVRLALQTGAVAQQLAQAHPVQPGPGQVVGERVVQAEPALVAQAEHERRGQGLGDGTDPVLGVPARHRVLPGRADVHDLPAAHDGGDHGRGPPAQLGTRDDLVDLTDGLQG